MLYIFFSLKGLWWWSWWWLFIYTFQQKKLARSRILPNSFRCSGSRWLLLHLVGILAPEDIRPRSHYRSTWTWTDNTAGTSPRSGLERGFRLSPNLPSSHLHIHCPISSPFHLLCSTPYAGLTSSDMPPDVLLWPTCWCASNHLCSCNVRYHSFMSASVNRINVLLALLIDGIEHKAAFIAKGWKDISLS